MLLKNQWVNDEIKRNSENTLRQMKTETQLSKIMGYSKSSSKRDVHSNTGISQETRKI